MLTFINEYRFAAGEENIQKNNEERKKAAGALAQKGHCERHLLLLIPVTLAG